jgi:hypothetical protein
MAQPSTRQQLIDYCLRKLGHPVLQINIDNAQIDDLVDDALQLYQERHFDGIERMYLKHQVTAADMTRFKTSDTTTTGTSGSVTSSFTERNNYIAVPDHIVGIQKVFGLKSSSIRGNLFGIEYQIFLNDLYQFGSVDILNYYMTKSYLETLDMVLNTGSLIDIRFNRKNDRLYLDINVDDFNENEYLIIDCYRALDPTTYTQVYNDIWMKKYLTALIKKQWGQNLIKFNNVQLPGGITLNGRQIYEDAVAEIEELKQQLYNEYELPPLDMIG